VLTIIAFLLGWNTFFRDPTSLVHAQPAATTYRAEWITTGWDGEKPVVPFEQKLNATVGGGEIVAVVPHGENNRLVWVIFRQRR
jgi:hypothetical protein